MPAKNLKVVHYLNQFFGGLGGEDKASIGPRINAGPVGPGRAIQTMLRERGEVVATAICGDNYFAENMDKATQEIINLIRPYQPDIVIAGPAFEAGRYGIACGAICKAVKDALKIPTITGMYFENPGVDMYHKDTYIVQTGNSVRTMNDAVTKMISIVLRLSAGEKIGRADVEGYYPRGIVANELVEKTGADRVTEMLLAKLQGKPFDSEVSQPKYERITPALAVKDLKHSIIALVTDGGLIPKGNPDKIEALNATHYGKYSIKDKQTLDSASYDVNHAGYDPAYIRLDPNRLVPVDVMREMEQDKTISKLHEIFYSTTGVATTVENSRRMGREIAQDLKAAGVSAVILTST
jgi:glycine reductase complex component B subunit gamma